VELLVRDTKVLETFIKHAEKKLKEMNLFKHLKKEVETGANGTQDYIIKKGENTGKVAKNNAIRNSNK
jgi:ribosomal protein S7